MITEQELMAIADRKERFELSMIYMMLHGGGTFIDPLTLDDVKAIRSTVLHVCNGMDCTSQKEGTEYFNVEAGDKGYKGKPTINKLKNYKETMTIKKAAEIVRAIKSEYDEDVIKDYKIQRLTNINTGKNTGSAVVLQLSTRYDYDNALIAEWQKRFQADDWFINVCRNQLRIHFNVRQMKDCEI